MIVGQLALMIAILIGDVHGSMQRELQESSLANVTSNHRLPQDSVHIYQTIILRCLARIHDQLTVCIDQFRSEYHENLAWVRREHPLVTLRRASSSSSSSSSPSTPTTTPSIGRRLCCMQNTLKECWTRAIQSRCTPLERPLSIPLPLKVLTDLSGDKQCHLYVLYPHKCRTNLLSLWQILAFLFLVPALAAITILSIVTIVHHQRRGRGTSKHGFRLVTTQPGGYGGYGAKRGKKQSSINSTDLSTCDSIV